MMMINVCTDWVDLWVRDGGYFDGVQDALPRVALHLLYAETSSVQGLSAYQLVRSVESSAAMGSGIRGDFAQQALPALVRLLRQLEMLGEVGIYQYHHLSLDILASRGVLHTSSYLSADWQIHHPDRKSPKFWPPFLFAQCSEHLVLLIIPFFWI